MRKLAALLTGVITAGLLTTAPAIAQESCVPQVTKAWATKTVVVGPTYQVPMTLRATTYDECAPMKYVDISWRRSGGHWDYAELAHIKGDVPTEIWGRRVAVDPYLLLNSAAGRHTIDVDWVEDTAYNYDTNQLNVGSLYLKRATRLRVNASPEPVRRGKSITVTGKLRWANWTANEWRNYRYRYVKLQYKRAGTGSFNTLKTVKSNRYGDLRTTVTARRDGTFRWRFLGNAVAGPRVSKGDYVDVR